MKCWLWRNQPLKSTSLLQPLASISSSEAPKPSSTVLATYLFSHICSYEKHSSYLFIKYLFNLFVFTYLFLTCMFSTVILQPIFHVLLTARGSQGSRVTWPLHMLHCGVSPREVCVYSGSHSSLTSSLPMNSSTLWIHLSENCLACESASGYHTGYSQQFTRNIEVAKLHDIRNNKLSVWKPLQFRGFLLQMGTNHRIKQLLCQLI